MTCISRSPLSSSTGLSGLGPANTTDRFLKSVLPTNACTFSLPARMLLNPPLFSYLSILCTDGERISPSISSTRLPVLAIAIASPSDVVDLPSSGCALVTRIDLGRP